MSIFISYARKDKNQVLKIAIDLRDHGLEVWYDEKIDPGSRWSKAIENQIKGCHEFIVLLSPAVEHSEWVERECLHALKLEKRVIPVIMVPSMVPWFLDNIQAINMTTAYDDTLEELLSILSHEDQKKQPESHAKILTLDSEILLLNRVIKKADELVESLSSSRPIILANVLLRNIQAFLVELYEALLFIEADDRYSRNLNHLLKKRDDLVEGIRSEITEEHAYSELEKILDTLYGLKNEILNSATTKYSVSKGDSKGLNIISLDTSDRDM